MMAPITYTSISLLSIIFFFHNALVEGMPQFSPLLCNDNVDSIDCSKKLSSVVAAAGSGEVLVPCGECVIVDYVDGSTVEMAEGLIIEGKLFFPNTANVVIRTTHIFVMGKLEMVAPASPNTVKFRLYGTADKYIHPTYNNAGICDAAGCKVGKKPFAVAGGQVDIRGLSNPDNCPSWGKLVDLRADPNDASLMNRVTVSISASCWNVGDTIILTSPDWDINHSHETIIIGIDATQNDLIVEPSVPSYFGYATMLTAPDYAVEVASISRSIIFEGEDDEQPIGGHMIVYHTPNVVQTIEGAEFVNFGQQGNLGRYPIHFHMSQDVTGSQVSKNVIHHSNQRGIVIHGSMNVQITDNVAYEIFGHCFFTEDGIETGNIFERNLGANIRKPAIVIPNENDDNPSVFWITNPQNSWIDNVAAGSVDSGFWFDTRDAVRGPSRNLPGGDTMIPGSLSITRFEGNTAHSNIMAGMRYYDPGWRPMEDNNTLKNSRVYRNLRSGHFIHGNWNIVFDGGLIADNGVGIRIFKTGNLRLKNTAIKGRTEEYQNIIENIPNAWAECYTGLEFQHSRIRVINHAGMEVSNIQFSDFGPKCGEAIAINTEFVVWDNHQYDSGDALSAVSFANDGSVIKKINMCYAMTRKVDSVAIFDADGSLDPNNRGNSGFLVSAQEKNLAFANGAGCTEIPGACAHFCESACLRNVWVTVNGALNPILDIEMVISNQDGKEGVAQARRHDFEDKGDVNVNYDVRYDGYFGAALPEGTYDFSFRRKSTGEATWPDFASVTYGLPPKSCDNYVADDSITLMMPEFEPDRCLGELLKGVNLEDIYRGGWQAQYLHLDKISSASGDALRASRTSDDESYLSQYIDRSCLVDSTIMEFSADIRFQKTEDGTPILCNDCLRARIEFLFNRDLTYSFPIGTTSSEDLDGEWYKVKGSLSYDDYSVHLTEQGKKVTFKIEHTLNGIDSIIRNASLQLKEYESPTSSPTRETDTQEPTDVWETINLALNKPATQTSTLGDLFASYANDGDVNTYTQQNNWYQLERTNYWEVDLEIMASINKIRIYNRPDCCQYRLNNTIVTIHDLYMDIVATEIISFVEDDTMLVELDFDDIEGVFVRVEMVTDNFLSLAEVEVYGAILGQLPSALPSASPTENPTSSPTVTLKPSSTPSSAPPTTTPLVNLALNKPAQQSSNFTPQNIASNAVDGYIYSTSHTAKSTGNWLLVSLGVVANIERIVLYNPNCCKERLEGTIVKILDYNGEIVFISDKVEGDESIIIFDDFGSIEGASINVTQDENYLVLADLEVWGLIANQLPSALPSQSPVPSNLPSFSPPSNSPSFVPSALPTTTPLTNLALNRPAEQSFTLFGWEASRAVDGDLTTSTHTAGGSNNWLNVTLEPGAIIEKIVIYNRHDCCWDRLIGAVVKILDDEGVEMTEDRYVTAESDIIVFDYNENIEGATQVVIKQDTQILSISELHVLGSNSMHSSSPSVSQSLSPSKFPTSTPDDDNWDTIFLEHFDDGRSSRIFRTPYNRYTDDIYRSATHSVILSNRQSIISRWITGVTGYSEMEVSFFFKSEGLLNGKGFTVLTKNYSERTKNWQRITNWRKGSDSESDDNQWQELTVIFPIPAGEEKVMIRIKGNSRNDAIIYVDDVEVKGDTAPIDPTQTPTAPPTNPPAPTTPLPPSTTPVQLVKLFEEDFENGKKHFRSNNFSTEQHKSGVTSAFTTGRKNLMSRWKDVTAYSQLAISFWFRGQELAHDKGFKVQILFDRQKPWIQLKTYKKGSTFEENDKWIAGTINNIEIPEGAQIVRVRFNRNSVGRNEVVFFDDVIVSGLERTVATPAPVSAAPVSAALVSASPVSFSGPPVSQAPAL